MIILLIFWPYFYIQKGRNSQISTSTHHVLLSGFREAAMTNCFSYCSKGSVPLTFNYAIFNELHRFNKTTENTCQYIHRV